MSQQVIEIIPYLRAAVFVVGFGFGAVFMAVVMSNNR